MPIDRVFVRFETVGGITTTPDVDDHKDRQRPADHVPELTVSLVKRDRFIPTAGRLVRDVLRCARSRQAVDDRGFDRVGGEDRRDVDSSTLLSIGPEHELI